MLVKGRGVASCTIQAGGWQRGQKGRGARDPNKRDEPGAGAGCWQVWPGQRHVTLPRRQTAQAAKRQALQHHLKQLPPEKHTAQKMITLRAGGQAARTCLGALWWGTKQA